MLLSRLYSLRLPRALHLAPLRPLSSSPLSLSSFIEEVKPSLKPPVANRMIFNEQIQLMVVGGPNQRKDFHINEGEEIFYQLEGDMELKIIEKGRHQTIVIPEGHMFVLPARIPHSPQRFANTIGMVLERLRHKHESDGLRYYVDESTDVLYEEYFHCKDLGSELVPVINRFFASDAYRTNTPGSDMPIVNPPVTIDTSTSITKAPFQFSKFLQEIRGDGRDGILKEKAVHGAEFNMNIAFGAYKGPIQRHRTGVATDTLLWQFQGSSEIRTKDSVVKLQAGDIHLAVTGDEIHVDQSSDNGCLLSFTTNSFDQA